MATSDGLLSPAARRISVRQRPRALGTVVALASGRLGLPGAASLEPPSRATPDRRSSGVARVRILGVNDFHGWLATGRAVDGRPIGGGAYLAAHVARLRAALPHATVVVHAGDMVSASPAVSALFQDEPALRVVETIGFDVGVAGNHEFDEGVPELLRLLDGGCHPTTAPLTGCFPGTSFPTLAANVVRADSGEPLLPPYHVVARDGVRIGFVGVVTTETPNAVGAGVAGLVVLDEAETANRYAAALRARGVHAIVVLAHLGGVAERADGPIHGPVADFAARLDDAVSVVVSAHTHRGYAATVAGKLVTQAWAYGEGVAAITLDVDRGRGTVVAASAELVRAWNDEVEPDEGVAALVAGYEALAAPRLAEVVADAATDITRAAGPSGEQALGNLIADAYRWATGADAAVAHRGWNWADLAAGPVTVGDLFRVQPANHDLIALRLSGDQLRRLLEEQWRPAGDHLLSPSGLAYDVDPGAPAGERVRSLRGPHGNPVSAGASYTVAMSDFLAGGGDGFRVPLEATAHRTGPKDLEALIAYLRHLPQPVAPTPGGRIGLVEPSAPTP